jgi:hypothetical protein
MVCCSYICAWCQVLPLYYAWAMLNVPLSDAVTQMLLHVRTLHASAYKGSITVLGLEWTSRPADAVTSTPRHSSCQWSVRTVFGVIFIDFIEQISLTNCAFRFRFGAIARWPLIAVQTQLSQLIEGNCSRGLVLVSAYHFFLCCEEGCGNRRRVFGGVPKMRAAMLFALGALLVCNLAWTEAATTGAFRRKVARAHALLARVSESRLFKAPLG